MRLLSGRRLPWWSAAFAPAVVAAAGGVALSIAAFIVTTHISEIQGRRELDGRAAIYRGAFERSVHSYVDVFETFDLLTGIAATSGQNAATSAFLRDFSNRALAERPALLALGWAPLITDVERGPFEAGNEQRGGGGRILDSIDGRYQSAARRDRYVPVTQIETAHGVTPPVSAGWDLLAVPAIAAALDDATFTAGYRVSRPFVLPGAEDHGRIVLMVVPVSRGPAARDPSAPRAAISGYVVGFVGLDEFMRTTFSDFSGGLLTGALQVRGVSGPPVTFPRGVRWAAMPSTPIEPAVVAMPGQVWELSLQPAAGVSWRAASLTALAPLVGGLLLTALVCLYLVNTARNNGRLRALSERLSTEALERRRADAALRRSERRFRALVEQASDLIMVIDREQIVTDVTPSVQRMFGLHPEDCLGRPIASFLTPEQVTRSRAAIAATSEVGAISAPFALRLLDAQGEPHDLEVLATNLLHVPGVEGIVLNIRDVTDRARAEAALREANDELERRVAARTHDLAMAITALEAEIDVRRRAEAAAGESERRYRLLAENSTDMISRHAADGAYLYVSQACARLLGYQPEEMVGRPLYDFLHPDDRAVLLDSQISLVDLPETFTVTLRVRHANGSYIWLETSGRCVRGADNARELEVLCSSRDVSDRKQAEDALRESEERMRLIIDAALDGAVTLDAAGTITGWNRQAEAIFGWAAFETLGRDVVSVLVPPRQAADPDHVLRRYLTAAGSHWDDGRLEFHARHRDGHEFPLELSIAPLTMRDRTGYSAFVRDISERRAAEEALRLSEERYRSVVNTIKEAIFQVDETGVWTFLSPAWTDITGYSLEESIFRDVLDFVHTGDRAAVAEMLRRVLEGETREHRRDLRIVTAGGGCRWVEALVGPTRDGGGLITGIAGTLTDITERREADARLRYQKTLLETQLEASPDGMLVVSSDRQILSYNRRFSELWGFDLTVVGPGSSHAAVQAAMEKVKDPEQFRDRLDYLYAHPELEAEDVIELRDGRTLDRYTAPVRAADGQFYGRIWFYRDTTERTRAQEALVLARTEAETANRAKSEFLSRMSHELRTPLNAILGFAQLLEIEVEGEEQQESVEYILKAGKHLLSLINEVLDISRIEANRLTVSLDAVPLQATVVEAVQMVQPLADQREITVRLRLGQEASVLADQQRLKQVLLNLLGNAIKYNVPGGLVTVLVERHGPSSVRISVVDTGHGIPTAKQPRLFVPFDRLDVQTAEVEGTGLGLALSKRLTELMGGTIGFASAEGAGSTFWIDLPLAAPSLATAAAGTATPAPATAPSDVMPAHTVLYIEDNPSNVRLMERILVDSGGRELLVAVDGQSGLALAVERRPDLVLLDLNLRDLHGSEILRRLREQHATRSIPVVIVSADATPAQIEQLLAEGAADYLTKPFDVQHFRAVLDRVLSGRGGAAAWDGTGRRAS